MNKKAIFSRIVVLLLIVLFLVLTYYLFVYKAPPRQLDNKYLIGTTEIFVYSENISNDTVLINHITDKKIIDSVIHDKIFKKLPAGEGLDGSQNCHVVFSGNNFSYDMFFDSTIAEISFFPDVQFSNWDNLNVQSGSIVPVYRLDLDPETFNVLTQTE